MKIAFAGTPDFAARALAAILAAGHPVPLVLTQPDRRAGRGMERRPAPVKALALEHGLALHQPESLKTEEARRPLRDAHADVLVVAAYGLILPPAVLEIPPGGCINIHASLLPRWRGAAPIQRTILAGDAESGVTIMRMDAGLDTGPMLLQQRFALADRETAATLHDRLAAVGAELIVEVLRRLSAAVLPAQPQPAAGVTYAPKVDKREAVLDWRQGASALDRVVRAFNPAPGAATQLRQTAIKVWQARPEAGTGAPGEVLSADRSGIVVACGVGALRLLELQKPGGNRLPADAFLRGFPLRPGDRFALPAD